MTIISHNKCLSVFLIVLLLFLFKEKCNAQCNNKDSLDFTWSLTNNCQPVAFQSIVNFGKSAYTYLWKFGDSLKDPNPPEKVQANPSHIYINNIGTPVTYTVKLTVTDNAGKVCWIKHNITVTPSPVLLTDSTPYQSGPFVHCIVQGDTCALNIVNSSPYINSHYNIKWGDGAVFDSAGFPAMLSHMYASSGEFQLVATTPGGCISYPFFCGSNPAGGIACPANRLACVGLQLDFPIDSKTLNNAAGTTYQIAFQDGSPDAFYTQTTLPAVISHVYKGNKDCIPMAVQMVATNPCGFTNSSCYPISVSTKPIPDIGVRFNYAFNCANITKYQFMNATSPCCIKIDGTKDDGLNLTWSITPSSYKIVKGKLDSSTIFVIFTKVDCYSIKLKVLYQNKNCWKCGDTDIIKIICVDTLPIAKAIPSDTNNLNACTMPFTVNFTNLSINAKSYNWLVIPKQNNDPNWQFVNNSDTTSKNPSIQFLEPGKYNVILQAYNECGFSAYTINLNFYSPPKVVLKKPITYCSLDSFNYVIDVKNVLINYINSNTTYLWTISPTTGVSPLTSVQKYPSFFFHSNHLNNYKIKVTANNNNLCNSSGDSSTIVFSSKPAIKVSSNTLAICMGDTVTLSLADNSGNNPNSVTYRWYQPDSSGGLTSFYGTNVKASPLQNSTYSVKGFITNDSICMDSVSINITVKPNPVIGMTPKNINICPGDSVRLTASGAGTYKWQVLNMTDSSIVVKPVVKTIYIVDCVGKDDCKGTDTATVDLYPAVQAIFTNKSIEFINNSVLFTNTSTGAISYIWDFGDGSAGSTFQNPTHSYSNPGTYNIVLTAYSNRGCPNKATSTIKIIAPKPFTIKSDTGCSPFTDEFINNAIDLNMNYFWNFGFNGLTSTAVNPGNITYITNTDTIFTVTVYFIYNSDTISTSAKIHVFTKAFTDFTVTPDCGCPILNVVITNRSYSGLLYSCFWNLGNGNTIKEPISLPHSATHNASYPGKPNDTAYYNITLTDSNTCGKNTHTETIKVFPQKIIANFSVNNNSVCTNQIIQFINNSQFYNNLIWDFGDSSKSDEINPTHYYNTAGTYLVKLVCYKQCNACGGIGVEETAVFSLHITVNKVPEVAFSIDAISNTCVNGAVYFSNASEDPIDNFIWNFGDPESGAYNISNSSAPIHIYKNPGTYKVKLIGKTLNFSPCSDTVSKHITINSKPVSSFTDSSICLNLGADFINKSKNFSECYWSFGDGNFSSEIKPVHYFKEAGNYMVTLITLNTMGCADTSQSIINVYPIPVANFTYTSYLQNGQLQVWFDNRSTLSCQYYWTFGDGASSSEISPQHNYSQGADYKVNLKVTNQYGCIADTTIEVTDKSTEYHFYIPNAFIPGGNSPNNTFYPVVTMFSSYHMQIFSRWGELLFDTHEYYQHWDGTFNGEIVAQGVYVYVIEVTEASTDATPHNYKGYVTVLRK